MTTHFLSKITDHRYKVVTDTVKKEDVVGEQPDEEEEDDYPL